MVLLGEPLPVLVELKLEQVVRREEEENPVQQGPGLLLFVQKDLVMQYQCLTGDARKNNISLFFYKVSHTSPVGTLGMSAPSPSPQPPSSIRAEVVPVRNMSVFNSCFTL